MRALVDVRTNTVRHLRRLLTLACLLALIPATRAWGHADAIQDFGRGAVGAFNTPSRNMGLRTSRGPARAPQTHLEQFSISASTTSPRVTREVVEHPAADTQRFESLHTCAPTSAGYP